VHIVLVLILDTSTPAVTAAVARMGDDTEELLAQGTTVDARAHGELLAPAVGDVLRRAGGTPRDLAAIVAGTGPGPFTGLRVGLVTAATMGQALGIPTYGVCSLDALAVPGETVLVATDARRREVYWAVYGPAGERLSGPDVARPADLPPSGATVAVGDGALKYRDVLDLPVRAEPRYPQPAALAARAAERVLGKAPSERLTPLYLRRPDAVASAARKPVLP
jgi:tRNA threonylcarbamoyl adenosine modification protein YeaZ